MIGSRLARLRQEFKKGCGQTVAEVMDVEVDGEDEILSKRPREAERPNPVVASIFRDR